MRGLGNSPLLQKIGLKDIYLVNRIKKDLRK